MANYLEKKLKEITGLFDFLGGDQQNRGLMDQTFEKVVPDDSGLIRTIGGYQENVIPDSRGNIVEMSPLSNQYGDRDLLQPQIGARMSRDMERDMMEQTIVDRNTLISKDPAISLVSTDPIPMSVNQELRPGGLAGYTDKDLIDTDAFRSYGQGMRIGDTKPGITQEDFDVMPIKQDEETVDQSRFMQFYNDAKSTLGDLLPDEETRLKMARGFNTMRLNKDDSLGKSIDERLKTIQSRKGLTRSIFSLRQMILKETDPNKQAQLFSMLKIAENNPEFSKDIVQDLMKMLSGIQDPSEVQSYAPRYDADGKEYIPIYNKITGTVEREYTGGIGLGAQQKIEAEVQAKAKIDDIKAKNKLSDELYTKMSGISSDNRMLAEMLETIDQGAWTGWLANYFPTLTAQTGRFEQLANQLGLNVVGSVTFGALSESELKLAMATAVPRGLSPEQQIEWTKNKIRANNKMQNELIGRAQRLQEAKSMDEFRKGEMELMKEHAKYDYYSDGMSKLQGKLSSEFNMSYRDWQNLNLNERKEFLKRSGLKL